MSAITRRQWAQIKALFHEALGVPPEQRRQWIESRTGDDTASIEARELVQRHIAGELLPDRVSPPPPYFGAYKVICEAGRGGMATVYAGERSDGQFQRRVAIKVLRSGVYGDQAQQRFFRERQLLADLDHPNIVKLLDGGVTDDGRPYFVQDFIGGPSITEYAASLGLPDRVRLLIPVCRAVHCAHQRGIVHRDLKPGNILTTVDGTPKLLDFGIARLLGPEQGMSGAQTQQFLTPEYASPEQLSGAPVTLTSDIYSLGLVLYEVVALKRATAPRDMEAVPPAIRRVLSRALEIDPARRYPSAEQMAVALESAVASGLDRPVSWRRRAILCATLPTTAAALYVTRPAASRPSRTRLLKGAGSPGLSLDGREIVYSGYPGIYLKNLETGAITKITNRDALGGAISRDGNLIAYSYLNGKQWILATAGRSGAGERIRTNGLGCAWTPDGRGLLYADRPSEHEPSSIYYLDLESGQKRRITSPPGEHWGDMAVSADPRGGRFAFARYSRPGNGDVYVSTIDGSELRRLTRFECWIDGTGYSPEGSEIIFGGTFDSFGGIWRVSTTGEPKPYPVLLSEKGDRIPSVAMTGGALRIAVARRELESAIYQGTIRTGTKPVVTKLLNGGEWPAFSPDGRRIAFVTQGDNLREICLMDVDRLATRRIANFGTAGIRSQAGRQMGHALHSQWRPGTIGAAYTS